MINLTMAVEPFDRIYKMEHLEIMNIDTKSGKKLYITKIDLK